MGARAAATPEPRERMLSKKARYGLRALLQLAEAWEAGPILIAELARRDRIPLKFLETILLTLKRAGYLESKKGRGGGYSLARPPEAVLLGDILRLLDGPLALVPCASLTAYRKCEECADEEACGIRIIMKEVREATAGILDRTSLRDLLDRERGARSGALPPVTVQRGETSPTEHGETVGRRP